MASRRTPCGCRSSPGSCRRCAGGADRQPGCLGSALGWPQFLVAQALDVLLSAHRALVSWRGRDRGMTGRRAGLFVTASLLLAAPRVGGAQELPPPEHYVLRVEYVRWFPNVSGEV